MPKVKMDVSDDVMKAIAEMMPVERSHALTLRKAILLTTALEKLKSEPAPIVALYDGFELRNPAAVEASLASENTKAIFRSIS